MTTAPLQVQPRDFSKASGDSVVNDLILLFSLGCVGLVFHFCTLDARVGLRPAGFSKLV